MHRLPDISKTVPGRHPEQVIYFGFDIWVGMMICKSLASRYKAFQCICLYISAETVVTRLPHAGLLIHEFMVRRPRIGFRIRDSIIRIPHVGFRILDDMLRLPLVGLFEVAMP